MFNKRNKNIILNCFFLALSFVGYTQKKVITGNVYHKETGKPLVGINVMTDKSKSGTVTDSKGAYSISVKSNSTVLIFSSIGFATQTIIIDGKSVIDVNMVPSYTENSEVVVIGYGTQKKSDLTGSISKYKNDRLDEAPVSRLDQALQGKIAGVQVDNTSSLAGDAPKVTVRGISSIYAGANPLVVVDGQPVADGLAYVNMADIESVEVLKDAASAAIYGSRGASGVILITTKSGKIDKPKYKFKYSVGFKTPYKRYDVMTYTEYVNNLFYEASLKALDTNVITPTGTDIATNNERAAYIVETTLLNGQGTDWQSLALRTGLTKNIQLSASGGKSGIKYFISGGYQKEEGMMIHSGFDKFNVRSKIDFDLSKKTKLVININPSYSKKQSPSENYTNFVRYPSFMPAYHTALTAENVHQLAQWANVMPGDFAQPRHFSEIYYSGYMPDGSFWAPSGTSDPFNSSTNSPLSSILNTSIITNEYRIQASAELTIKIRRGLDFKSLATSYVNSSNLLNWSNKNAEADGLVSKGVYTNTLNTDLLSENTLNYTKSIKDHSFVGLLGFTTQKTNTDKNQTTGLDYPNNDIRTLNNASQIDKSGTFGTKTKVGLISYLGRVNYTYQSKYLLSASFRTDGSSYFGPGNKWGTFPSVSIGWIANKEKFFKNITWINKLKLRSSYGVSGNNRILDFGFLDLLYPANYAFGSGTGSVNAGQATSTTIRSNPNITWERTFQNNYGADISLAKNKINVTLDYYISKTDRLLLQQSAMAFSGVPLNWNNIGSLKNRGIEVEITTSNLSKGDFKWNTSANIAHTQNKILELGNEAYLINQGERNEIYQNKVGNPLIQYFGFKTNGIWLSQAEIDAAKANGLTSPFSNAFVPGQLKIVDVDHNNIIDNNDRTVIGSPYPDFTWGITNTINYRAFDLSFTFQGVQGGSLINGDPNYDETKKLVKVYNTNRWVSPLFPGDGYTPNYNKSAFNWMLTDYVVEDASYYSLRELNVGYTFPDDALSSSGINSIRLYCSAQNLFFHSAKQYRGINPEGRFSTGVYNSALIGGYQRGSFPIPKTIMFGVDIGF